MQKTNFSIDDIGQVTLLPLENLDSELIQANSIFGFDSPTKPLSSKDIDNALIAEKFLLDKKINYSLFEELVEKFKIPELAANCDGRTSFHKAFGFPGLSLILELESEKIVSINLVEKSFRQNEQKIIVDFITEISKVFNLFLVDNSLGIVVDSCKENLLNDYFDATH